MESLSNCRLVHEIPANARFVLMSDGRTIVAPADHAPYIVGTDGAVTPLVATERSDCFYEQSRNIYIGFPAGSFKTADGGDMGRW